MPEPGVRWEGQHLTSRSWERWEEKEWCKEKDAWEPSCGRGRVFTFWEVAPFGFRSKDSRCAVHFYNMFIGQLRRCLALGPNVEPRNPGT